MSTSPTTTPSTTALNAAEDARAGRLLGLPAPVRDAALLLARVVLGVILIAHGVQKFFDVGLDGIAQGFSGMGVPLPQVAATFVATVELVGGALLVLGLLTPLAGLLVVVNMIGAWWFAHRTQGIFVADGGWELVGAIGAGALMLALAGPGRWSVDALIAARRSRRVEDAAVDASATPTA